MIKVSPDVRRRSREIQQRKRFSRMVERSVD
jgi:hypothetical protein